MLLRNHGASSHPTEATSHRDVLRIRRRVQLTSILTTAAVSKRP